MLFLPHVFWGDVASMLGDRDRLALSRVCSQLRSICESRRYWKKLKMSLFHSFSSALGFNVSRRRLKNYLDGEEKVLLKKYSHYVQRLTLRVVNFPLHCRVHPRCLQVLQRYSRRWPVRSLTLHLSGRSANPNHPPRGWTALFRKLLAPSWSDTLQDLTILCDLNASRSRRWTLFDLLGGRLPTRSLVSLIMYPCGGQHGTSYSRDVFSFVRNISSLQELSVHHKCVSERLLSRLRSVPGLQCFRIYFTRSFIRAPLADGWSKLVRAKPGLAVELVLHSRNLFTYENVALVALPPPFVPVRACYLQDTEKALANNPDNFKRMLNLLLNYAPTLSTLRLDVSLTKSQGDVLAFVTRCSKLQHIVVLGRVRASTILLLSRLERKWLTFTFNDDIAFEEMDIPRSENIRQLCESVREVKSAESWRLVHVTTEEQRRKVVFVPACADSDLNSNRVITLQFS